MGKNQAGADVPVRHDTSVLSSALDLIQRQAMIPTLIAEAEVRSKVSRAVAVRRLATGSAVAIAALAIGVAIFLSTRQAPVSSDNSRQTPETLEPETSGKLTTVPTPSKSPNRKEAFNTTDFNIFKRKIITHANRQWEITAGHHFLTESDQEKRNWNRAWCYIIGDVNGLVLNAELAVRVSPKASPTIDKISCATVRALGLDPATVDMFIQNCPWVDERQFPSQRDAITDHMVSCRPPENQASESRVETKENTAISGATYAKSNVADSAACGSSCTADTNCKGYSFDGRQLICRKYSRVDKLISAPNVVSGVK